jgi:hypothetical protein
VWPLGLDQSRLSGDGRGLDPVGAQGQDERRQFGLGLRFEQELDLAGPAAFDRREILEVTVAPVPDRGAERLLGVRCQVGHGVIGLQVASWGSRIACRCGSPGRVLAKLY